MCWTETDVGFLIGDEMLDKVGHDTHDGAVISNNSTSTPSACVNAQFYFLKS